MRRNFYILAAALIATGLVLAETGDALAQSKGGDRTSRDNGPAMTSSDGGGSSRNGPNCYATTNTYRPRCDGNAPVLKSCYCGEIRIRTADGRIVRRLRCTETPTKDIGVRRLEAESCDAIRQWPMPTR